jgi:hypothetical protein
MASATEVAKAKFPNNPWMDVAVVLAWDGELQGDVENRLL